MKFSDYIHDNKSVLLVCFTGALLFSVLLFSFGMGTSEMILLWMCFIIIVLFSILISFLYQRRRIQYLLSVFHSLDQKYLFAEIADMPETKLEQVYFRMMKTALKSMTDEVARGQRVNNEYRDFIEQWIHEIKVPITGIQLLCENNKSDTTRKIAVQTELLEQDVEKVLYYARLGNVEKDYLIKEMSLKECVLEVLSRNKLFLIQNSVSVNTENLSGTVYSDCKWIGFILNQIIFNSIKYQSERTPIIEFKSWEKGEHIYLSITDNGIGIRKSELGRVFDKGFVGSNGRKGRNATGMGLYLCDQLCTCLGISIDIDSKVNQYTTVILCFFKSQNPKS